MILTILISFVVPLVEVLKFSYPVLGDLRNCARETQTVYDLWDATNLKCTFRRCGDDRLMNMWLEIVQIASTISFTQEDNSLV
jgi:hypothetical protein